MDAFLKEIVRSRWLGCIVTGAAVLAAYSFMLHAPFRGMDDSTTIVANETIRSLQNIPQIFSSSFFGDRSYYRPLVSFSYMLEYRLFGLNAFFFNLDNVLLHILNALGVYFLIVRLFKDRALAWWASFLFAIHPVQWEAVANISGRVILLNTFFLLIAFCWFVDFNERRRIICLAGSLLSFFLALLCKESAAMFPVVLLLYVAFFKPEGKSRPWISTAPFFLMVLGMIILRRQLGITELFAWGSWSGVVLGFLSFARGVITYLRIMVLPVDLYFDRSRPVFQNFLDGQLWGTVIFWLAAVLMLWRQRSRMDPRVIFLILWFALELAPVSQIVTSLGVQPGFISLAEHFLYLPSVAMCTLLVLAFQSGVRLNRSKHLDSPLVINVATAGVILFLFLTTVQQNIYASNELAMLRRSIEHQPVNSRVQYSIGMYYAERGMFKVAEEHFARAVMTDPWNARARIALGKSLCDQGRYDEGIAVYRSIHDAGGLQSLLDENLRLSDKVRQERMKK